MRVMYHPLSSRSSVQNPPRMCLLLPKQSSSDAFSPSGRCPPQGDVYFEVDSLPGYGRLSGRAQEDNRFGERGQRAVGRWALG